MARTLPRTALFVALVLLLYWAFDITAYWCAGMEADSVCLGPYRMSDAPSSSGSIEAVICTKVATVEGAYKVVCPDRKISLPDILMPASSSDSNVVGPFCELVDRFRTSVTLGYPGPLDHSWVINFSAAIGQFFTTVMKGVRGALLMGSDSVCPTGCPEGGRLDKAFKDIFLHLNGELAFFGFETDCSCELFEDPDYRWQKNQFKAMVYGGTAVMLCIGGILIAFLTQPDHNTMVTCPSLTQAVVSKFKAIRLLHTNANANIFMMQQRSSGRWSFVKCLRADCSRLTRRNFITEIRALKAIKQSHIVKMLDWFHVGSRYGIALEFASCGSLDEIIVNRRDSYSLAEKRCIFRQLIEAVAWLHNMSWVHLNIRAGSVLVYDMWSTVKLSGFSRAVRFTEQTPCTVFDLHPNCCSPQVKGHTPYDPYQADVWALRGLFLYISTGQLMNSEQGGENVFILDQCSDSDNNISYTDQLLRVMAEYLSNDAFDSSYISVVMD